VGNIRLYLKANEKIFINGGVIKVDRKASIELLNDVTFLLESHVMQKEDATTPLKQLYFVVQMMLMHPENTDQPKTIFKKMITNLLNTVENSELANGIKEVDEEVSTNKAFSALKTIRKLIVVENKILNPEPNNPTINLLAAKKAAAELDSTRKEA
jgi:flagellar protein FlbT